MISTIQRPSNVIHDFLDHGICLHVVLMSSIITLLRHPKPHMNTPSYTLKPLKTLGIGVECWSDISPSAWSFHLTKKSTPCT